MKTHPQPCVTTVLALRKQQERPSTITPSTLKPADVLRQLGLHQPNVLATR